MAYRICKTLEIESGHMLARHPDVCRFPHGHTRKVEVVLEADTLDENGMVCDFKAVKESMAECLEPYDHALCVNTCDPMFESLRAAFGNRVIAFTETEPTTEVLAKNFYDLISQKLAQRAARQGDLYRVPPCVRVVKVRVWETSSSWAEYEPGR